MDKLKRKYGESIPEILQFQADQQTALNDLEKAEQNCGNLESEIDNETKALMKQADKLSDIRKKAASRFSTAVLENLKQLGLEKSEFTVEVQSNSSNLKTTGQDQVEFLISTNPGLPVQSLGKVVSGGELSRIMLAVQTLINQNRQCGMLVFDEVDAGISGKIASTVGEKLLGLSRHRQLLCITHSPQIASLARHHFKVSKSVHNNQSVTKVQALSEEERVQEIAQFLGGESISENTLSAAREMLKEQV